MTAIASYAAKAVRAVTSALGPGTRDNPNTLPQMTNPDPPKMVDAQVVAVMERRVKECESTWSEVINGYTVEELWDLGGRRWHGDHWETVGAGTRRLLPVEGGRYATAPVNRNGAEQFVINRIQPAIISDVQAQSSTPDQVVIEPRESGDPPLAFLKARKARHATDALALGWQPPQTITPAMLSGDEGMDEDQMGALLEPPKPAPTPPLPPAGVQPQADPTTGAVAQVPPPPPIVLDFKPDDFHLIDDKAVSDMAQTALDGLSEAEEDGAVIAENVLNKAVFGHQPVFFQWDKDRHSYTITNPPIRNVWIDATKTLIGRADWIMFDHVISVDEAKLRYPKFAAAFEEAKQTGRFNDTGTGSGSQIFQTTDFGRGMVTVRTLWERNVMYPMTEREVRRFGGAAKSYTLPTGATYIGPTHKCVGGIDCTGEIHGQDSQPVTFVTWILTDEDGQPQMTVAPDDDVDTVGPSVEDEHGESDGDQAQIEAKIGADRAADAADDIQSSGLDEPGVAVPATPSPIPTTAPAVFQSTPITTGPDQPNWPKIAGIRQVQVLRGVNRIILDQRCPYLDFPFAWNRNIPIINRPWGLGEAARLEGLQQFINKLATILYNIVRYYQYPVEFWPKSLLKELEDKGISSNSRPGRKVGVADQNFDKWLGGGKQGFAQYPPPVPQMYIDLLDKALVEFEKLSGQTDVQRGVAPYSGASGEAIGKLQGAANSVSAFKAKSTMQMLTRLARLKLDAMVKWLPESEWARFNGALSLPAIRECLKRMDYIEWDIRVHVGGVDPDRQMKIEQAKEARQQGDLSRETYLRVSGLVDDPERENEKIIEEAAELAKAMAPPMQPAVPSKPAPLPPVAA